MKTNQLGEQLDDDKAESIGQKIVHLLRLNTNHVAKDDNGKRYRPERYHTEWGTKTACGIARCVASIFDDNL
jgi:hypothetical protein